MKVSLQDNKGTVLIDVAFAIGVLLLMALIYAATVQGASQSRYVADLNTKAMMIADKEIEAIKALSYDNANYTSLLFYNLIDSSSNQSPFSFTRVGDTNNTVADVLPSGTGTVSIVDESLTLRKVTVTVSWKSKNGNRSYSVSTELAKLN